MKSAKRTMRFSSSLNSQSSHEALLLRQDTEVHLLELLKRSLAIRIKCDRDYSTSLQNFAAAFLKSENWQDVNESKVGLACRGFVMEAEALGRLMKENADYLAANTFEKLNTVLNEKKAAKRYYQEEHNRISADLLMVQEVVRRSKTEYEKCLEAYRSVKHKAEEASSKGKSGRKGDELKDKLQKVTRRLHNTHNEYVLALVAAADTDRDYRTVLLPGLLEYQQIAQEYLLLQWYNLLEDIGLHTQACLPEADHCHFRTQLADLRPDEEYVTFIEKHKCAPPPALELSFDYTLLQNSTGKLKPNELVMDKFTAETIKLKLRDIQSKVLDPQNALSLKVVCLEEKERLIEDKSKSPLELSLLRKEVEFLRKDINELRCLEQKMEHQVQLIHAALAAIPSDWEDMNDETPMPRETPSAPLNGGSVSKLGGQKIVSLLRKPFFRISTSSSKMDNLDKDSPSGSEANIANELESDNKSTLPLTIDQSVAEPVSAINVALSRKEEATSDLLETESDATPKFKLVFTAGKGLLEEEWFHGVLPREEVVRLLVHDGDFLVRETMRNEERQIVLSACWGGHKHFIVQTTAEALYRFEGPAFPTIQELIIHQYECGLPVTNKSGAVLKTPIIRARWELNNDDVELVEKVGRGNFGDVYRARLRSTGQDVAVKTCRVTLPDEQKRKFLQEGRILKQYDHINIVKFIGICVQKQPIMIVMELVPGGSLLTFLRNNAASLSAVCLLRMCRDAAYGMAYLEANNCIHRDLAARNCLVGVDNMVKISDFGMSREEQEYIVSDGMKQIPIKWTAPEALNYGKYTALCDVWSYGILCWEVFSKGGTPYAGLTNTKAREMIDAGYRMPAPEGTSPKMYWLMRRCWEAEADRRPHFNEICVIMDEILQLMSSS